MRRYWKPLRRMLFFGIIATFLVIHFFLPRIITVINAQPNALTDTKPSISYKDIHWKSIDDLTLSATLTYSTIDTIKGTILLLHGIRSQKEHFYPLAEKLANEGYHTVAIDNRAHGQSEGIHCTFGVKEKLDISKLIDYLQSTEKIKSPIGVWGQSLGGAIGLQAMANDNRIAFGIIESTFADFRTITHDYTKRMIGFNISPLTNYLIYRAGVIADFNPDEAKPHVACQQIQQPILVVHGDEDDRISIDYGRKNFDQLASTQKEFIVINGANHVNVHEVGGNDYWQKVLMFLEKS